MAAVAAYSGCYGTAIIGKRDSAQCRGDLFGCYGGGHAASQVAMTAIVKSPVAMAAMWRSDTAIKALQANATAWKTFTGATSAVMGKTVAILAIWMRRAMLT